MQEIKLTQYSHGSGCGCKISPQVLNKILHTTETIIHDSRLLVGNDTRDDAAVYELNEENVIISTTDFFMPIVDDPFDFGVIASVNALSDIYAMAGTPLMAIAILGWPLDKLGPDVASRVVNGARNACLKAGIPLAGGHSIDAPEPIFGLAVTGTASKKHLRTNSAATEGCHLYLTKPLGVGIMTTAQKSGHLKPEDLNTALNSMKTLNLIGRELGKFDCVKALTDVTGFGLLGHLIEMCEASNTSANLFSDKIPKLKNLDTYLKLNMIPGGTNRNFKSYGHKVSDMNTETKNVLCDPQTSGGLLIAIDSHNDKEFHKLLQENNLDLQPIGIITPQKEHIVTI